MDKATYENITARPSYYLGHPMEVDDGPLVMAHGLRPGRGDVWNRLTAIVSSGQLFPPPLMWGREGVFRPRVALWQHFVANHTHDEDQAIDAGAYQEAHPDFAARIQEKGPFDSMMWFPAVRPGVQSEAGRKMTNWFTPGTANELNCSILTVWRVEPELHKQLRADNFGGTSIYYLQGSYVMPQPLPLQALSTISVSPFLWDEEQVARLGESLEKGGFGHVQIVRMNNG